MPAPPSSPDPARPSTKSSPTSSPSSSTSSSTSSSKSSSTSSSKSSKSSTTLQAAPSGPATRPVATPSSGPATAEGTGASAPPRRARQRKLAALALVLAVCLAAVMTRAVWAGARALANGDAAEQRGELALAVDLWRQAARWYVPGATHVAAAYQRLDTLARAAEARGDLDTALAAWRGIRSSILATRSFYLPHAERLEPANRRIAVLMAALERAPARGPGDDGAPAPDIAPPADDLGDDEDAAWHYQRLAPVPGPSPFWSLVAIIGFATWLAGGLVFALRGVTPDDRLVPRTAAYAGILVACGLVIWFLGLYLA
jgi:hypothetical protein